MEDNNWIKVKTPTAFLFVLILLAVFGIICLIVVKILFFDGSTFAKSYGLFVMVLIVCFCELLPIFGFLYAPKKALFSDSEIHLINSFDKIKKINKKQIRKIYTYKDPLTKKNVFCIRYRPKGKKSDWELIF